MVSPTSIRSRILKDPQPYKPEMYGVVSPTSIRSRILKERRLRCSRLRASHSFTHVDPFEDTERPYCHPVWPLSQCFTHVDPFEDTERTPTEYAQAIHKSFTHVDPFEDTESIRVRSVYDGPQEVSPTSIRSRILKVPDFTTS